MCKILEHFPYSCVFIVDLRVWICLVPFGISKGSHRLEKYLNLEGFLEKYLKIKSALKSTEKSLKSLEKSLNPTFFRGT